MWAFMPHWELFNQLSELKRSRHPRGAEPEPAWTVLQQWRLQCQLPTKREWHCGCGGIHLEGRDRCRRVQGLCEPRPVFPLSAFCSTGAAQNMDPVSSAFCSSFTIAGLQTTRRPRVAPIRSALFGQFLVRTMDCAETADAAQPATAMLPSCGCCADTQP